MEPVKPVEPVKPAELVKVADPIKPVEPVVPSVPPPSKAPELVNHVAPVKEATPEVVKKEATPTPEITPAPQVTNHVADHVVKTPDKEVVEAEDASTVVDGDLAKSGSQLKLKYEYNVGKIQIKILNGSELPTSFSIQILRNLNTGNPKSGFI